MSARPKPRGMVEFDPGFKMSDLCAPVRFRDAVGMGKRMKPRQVSAEEQANSRLQKELRNASKDGKLGALRELVNAGVDINCKLDIYDYTALHYAAWHGRTEAVAYLLSQGSIVDSLNRDLKTPLHLAASNGHASTVRRLAERGASLTVRSKDDQTPLDCAEQWGNTETAAALRQVIADLEMKRRPGNKGWRVQSANRLDYPRRVASYRGGGGADNWAARQDYGREVGLHHASVQRVGVWPCTEAWG